jgi:hypothetical protein
MAGFIFVVREAAFAASVTEIFPVVSVFDVRFNYFINIHICIVGIFFLRVNERKGSYE